LQLPVLTLQELPRQNLHMRIAVDQQLPVNDQD
jgi:hypothetical protein